MTLEEQIENAKRSIEEWPDWMKRTAYFVGTDGCEDDAEEHGIEG